jgi:hypothetical protein
VNAVLHRSQVSLLNVTESSDHSVSSGLLSSRKFGLILSLQAYRTVALAVRRIHSAGYRSRQLGFAIGTQARHDNRSNRVRR